MRLLSDKLQKIHFVNKHLVFIQERVSVLQSFLSLDLSVFENEIRSNRFLFSSATQN